MGREHKLGSAFMATKDYSARTKLKFRQPGQTDASEIAKRDLKAELLRAEREALDKKRRAQGLAPLVDEVEKREPVGAIMNGDSEEDELARKRRKILEEAVELDKDDSDQEDEEMNGKSEKGKGKERAVDQDVDDEDQDDEWVEDSFFSITSEKQVSCSTYPLQLR
jgi:protein CWC15